MIDPPKGAGTKGIPIGIRDSPEPDGAYLILVRTPAGEECEISFSPIQALHFAHTIQKALLEEWTERESSPRYPLLALKDVNIAHGDDSSELLVCMEEIGSVVLGASNALLSKLRHEIDRVLDLRQSRKQPM
jgi:hypothetical protein